ncbi:MAG: ribosome small subunit-dependent GTPase A [Lachnospiraceae bacterium]|nr:ribosome small subunit-dependent GTPase A [Lachnospiraceae bacterium]
MTGKIIKGIGGFYYVHVVHSGIFKCSAKGIFRYKNIKPLVGDNVEIELINENELTGNIINVYKRTNELIRPAVANIDQALVVFAVKSPMPNLNLLDRFLVMMESQNVETIICFNKVDLVREEELVRLKDIYVNAGYQVIFTSAREGFGVDTIESVLKGKTTSLAGPSGVGKSSMINALTKDETAKTGDISYKIERGKHTTRHTEILNIGEDTYIMDTPGFSSVYVCECEKEKLKQFFPEIYDYEGECKFNGCVHINEPSCAVKAAVTNGKISTDRYENYKMMYEEIKNRKKY